MQDIRTISASPTASTAAYASGDLIGDKLTFDVSHLANKGNGGLVLDHVDITDAAKQSADVDLVLFLEDPSTGTVFTDNAAFDVAADDLSKIGAVIPVTTHHTFNSNNVSRATQLDLAVKMNRTGSDRNLYGALVSRATPTFAADSLGVKLTTRSA